MAEQLVPGRELDALVAVKVMRWPWRVWHFGKNTGKRFLADPLMEGWTVAQGTEPLHEDAVALVPSFSTDVTAAWRVVEKLSSLSYPIRLEEREDVIGDRVYVAMFTAYGAVKAKTAPHAICLAALQTVANAPVAPQEAPEHNARGLGHGDQDKPSETT